MNIFKKFFLGIMLILSLSTVTALFVLQNNRSFCFFQVLFSNISLMSHQIENVDLQRKFMNKGNEILVVMYYVKIYFFDFLCMSFEHFVNFCKYLQMFSLDQFIKNINDTKYVLINKLMHQSDLLNSRSIMDTVTIAELGTGNGGQVHWVIQLGALKNFQKVLKIVNSLKICNYPVYILPEYVQEGDLIRIFVGPYSSREHLEFLLDDLYRLSMLR